jgi:hypothetical protein
MAALSDADRHIALREFMRKAFMETGAKADFDVIAIRAAVDALDAWIDSNAAAINAALPLPFRTAASLQQKALLLAHVALKRGDIVI